MREGLPMPLASKIQLASQAAQSGMVSHVRSYERYPWATVRAAIRREGRFCCAAHGT